MRNNSSIFEYLWVEENLIYVNKNIMGFPNIWYQKDFEKSLTYNMELYLCNRTYYCTGHGCSFESHHSLLYVWTWLDYWIQSITTLYLVDPKLILKVS